WRWMRRASRSRPAARTPARRGSSPATSQWSKEGEPQRRKGREETTKKNDLREFFAFFVPLWLGLRIHLRRRSYGCIGTSREGRPRAGHRGVGDCQRHTHARQRRQPPVRRT